MADCKILTDGLYGGYYANYGATRSRRSFKTISGAIRHAESQGYAVDKDDLPNPNAKSIALRVVLMFPMADLKIPSDDVILQLELGAAVLSGPQDDFNKVLKRLGYKPVRVTKNILNPKGGWFVIDEDTPSCCDPGTETYHSM